MPARFHFLRPVHVGDGEGGGGDGWGVSMYMGYTSKERDQTAWWSGGFVGVQSALTAPAAKGR